MLKFDVEVYDPDGSWDNGFDIRFDLLQTKFFAKYTVARNNPYFFSFELAPSLNTPAANYTIAMQLFNFTDGSILSRFQIKIEVQKLVII